MEEKILLYNSSGAKIGETFARRARQLVKQQRASWMDAEQKAIQFAPDMENMDEREDIPLAIPVSNRAEDEKWLLELAEKRIKERKLFRIHTIALIPVIILMFTISDGIRISALNRSDALVVLGFFLGAWITLYAVHAFSYFRRRNLEGIKSDRKAKELAAELAMLKNGVKR